FLEQRFDLRKLVSAHPLRVAGGVRTSACRRHEGHYQSPAQRSPALRQGSADTYHFRSSIHVVPAGSERRRAIRNAESHCVNRRRAARRESATARTSEAP